MSQMTSYLGWKIDFGSPRGEPAFFAPDSMAWRIYKNPVALGVGGVAAVLLEFADARIRSGVWDHSVYKQDPIGRSRRTGIAAMVGVYGPQSAARRVIQGVNNMHARVAGQTPGGEAYSARDPELLDWVSATAAYGFVTAYDRFVAPLSAPDQTRYWREGSGLARLYGVTRAPRSTEDFMAMMEALLPRFEPHPIVGEFLGIIDSGGAAPGVPRYLQRALARGAVSILPAPVREKLALGPEYDLKSADRLALKAMGAVAERIGDPRAPWCEAAVRLSLPRDFVYRSPAAQQRLLAERKVAAPVPADAVSPG